MTTEQTNSSSFEGWAIVEIFGHQKYAGYLKTEYFGTACMFRLDVPSLPERTRVTSRAGSVAGQWAPAGTTVKEPSTAAYNKLFGIGAVYSITPCTEQAAIAALEDLQPRPLMLVSLPPATAITEGVESDQLEPVEDPDDSADGDWQEDAL